MPDSLADTERLDEGADLDEGTFGAVDQPRVFLHRVQSDEDDDAPELLGGSGTVSVAGQDWRSRSPAH
jgi:hypothetical protein